MDSVAQSVRRDAEQSDRDGRAPLFRLGPQSVCFDTPGCGKQACRHGTLNVCSLDPDEKCFPVAAPTVRAHDAWFYFDRAAGRRRHHRGARGSAAAGAGAGSSRPASTAMMATTTSSSIKVKPCVVRPDRWCCDRKTFLIWIQTTDIKRAVPTRLLT